MQRGYVHATLKVLPLSPTLCVGYAGAMGAALRAIREVASEGLGFDAVVVRFLAAHHDSKRASELRGDSALVCEFLVAGLRPSRLVQIGDGRADTRDAAWMGELEAFNDYQAAYHGEQLVLPREMYDSDDRADHVEIATRMAAGMNAAVWGRSRFAGDENQAVDVLRGGGHETVGEAVVTVGPRVKDGLFVYQEATDAQAPPFSEPPTPKPGVISADFGSAARGSFTYSLLTPRQAGVAALGIYFYEGRLGLYYAPLLSDGPERYRNVSWEHFIECVTKEHGIVLSGLRMRM